MGKWVFAEQGGASVRRNPVEAELFKTEQTEEGEYAGNDQLVREVLQNSIDASAGGGPVRVRFAIHPALEAPPADRLAHYFQRLRPALKHRQIEFASDGVPRIPCRYLVCEDFGTRGLEGNELLNRDPPAGDQRQDFYWFWRNIGRSGKTGDDLGRWGLGKTVYRAASRVGCMFGLSVRGSDRRTALMGQSVLKIHSYHDKEYVPEGYWCDDQDAQGLPLPITAADKLEWFSEDWHLTRGKEVGLSVVVPYVPEEQKSQRLLEAVAVNFFTRILRQELIVEVSGPDLKAVVLDAKGIEAACKRIKWDGPKRTKRHVAPPIAFARRCLSMDTFVQSKLLGVNRVPELTEDSFQETDLQELRQQFLDGKLISVRVQIALPRKLGDTLAGHADVYLERLNDGNRHDSYFVREGMTITKINSSPSLRGVRAFVVVDPGPLAQLLGDTEGAAHEDWDKSAERPDLTWKKGWKGRVGFVRNIVDRLVDLLTPSTTQPDFELLSDFFSVPRPEGNQRQRKPGDDTSDTTEMEPVIAVPNWFRITERAGGFTISRNAAVPLPKNAALKVSVAYDIPRGDPLRNWSPFDFQISRGKDDAGLRPNGKGTSAERPAGNVIILRNIQEDFHFSINGFDVHRDLYVRVDDQFESEPIVDEEVAT